MAGHIISFDDLDSDKIEACRRRRSIFKAKAHFNNIAFYNDEKWNSHADLIKMQDTLVRISIACERALGISHAG